MDQGVRKHAHRAARVLVRRTARAGGSLPRFRSVGRKSSCSHFEISKVVKLKAKQTPPLLRDQWPQQ